MTTFQCRHLLIQNLLSYRLTLMLLLLQVLCEKEATPKLRRER
jgi:hypothetical protein